MLTFLGFVIVVILLFWVSSISNRLAVLEKTLKEGLSGPAASAHPSAEPNSAAGAKPVPAMPAAPGWISPAVLPPQTSVPNIGAPSPAPADPTVALAKPAEESLLASGLLTKVGVLAVILGVGFFIKYAIDLGWINQWTRVILGVMGGALLCLLGGLWKDKYARYAAALTGGGVALMYFSVFASYQFYQLVPQPVALVCMVAVSALGVFLSYARKSLGLAALAALGAYLSPVMLNSGTDQHIGLFVYLALVNLAALAAAFIYYWNELLLLAFLGSVFDFGWWGANYLAPGNTMAAAMFAAFTFLLLILGGAAALRKHNGSKTLPPRADYYYGWLAALLGIFYVWSLYVLLYQNFHQYLAMFGLLGSVGAFLAYAIVDRLEWRDANYPLAFVGTALLALACVWHFTGKTTDFMLIAFGLFLVVVGVLLKRAELRVWGFLTLIGCIFAVLAVPYDQTGYIFILNSKFGLTLAEAAALWLTGWLYGQTSPAAEEQSAKELAHAAGSLVLWFGFSWEIVQYFQAAADVNQRNLLLSLWWIGYATVLLALGGAAKSPVYKKISLAIFVLAVLKVFLYDVLALETGYRIISFIVLGVILLSVSYFYQHNRERVANFLQGKEKT